jgi:pimeloyl-ACP methyl ester carboxylesterase
MDVGASFQFMVDALRDEWYCIAPDWRGFGESAWPQSDSYWFPDYYADLDALLDVFSPGAPVNLLGHSMGGNVACIYAGARPERIARLINVEGFGMMPTRSDDAPKRLQRWLNELREPQGFRDYDDFTALAERLRRDNPRLSAERAVFLSRHWGCQRADGRVALRSDPVHKRVNPVLYRLEEAKACWRAVAAPVLWIEGDETQTFKRMGLDRAALAERKECFAQLSEAVIAEAGHMIHHDQPEQLAAVVEAFLRREVVK